MTVSRATPGGEQYLALQRQARREGRPLDELGTLYALEGFLARLAESPERDSFVLKGGVLLAAYETRRPTRDADLLALALDNDRDVVEAKVRAIATRERADGLVFLDGSVVAEVIRDEDEYAGIRVKLTYLLARMELRIGVDVNVGDPVYPAPQEIALPGLLDGEVRLLGSPMVSVIAEKAVTAMQRGEANTRWRDFADIVLLARRHELDPVEIGDACATIARHRHADLLPIADLTATYPAVAQSRWAAWRRRQALTDELPEQFADVLAEVAALIDATTAPHR